MVCAGVMGVTEGRVLVGRLGICDVGERYVRRCVGETTNVYYMCNIWCTIWCLCGVEEIWVCCPLMWVVLYIEV